MKVLAFIVLVLVQLALLPLAIPAFLLAIYKQVVVSKRHGVSQTGIEVANGRWMMHWFGLREDQAAERLLTALPNCSLNSMRLLLLPLRVHHGLGGGRLFPRVPPEGQEAMADMITVRTLHFDRMIEACVPEVSQLVLLGAGYDTRAYGPLRASGLRFFELDRPETQALKVAALREAGIEATHVTFVEADFGRDDPWERLRSAGFDPAAKTIFLWEGVTLYLQMEEVGAMLGAVRSHAPQGSSLIADFYGKALGRLGGWTTKALEYTGETLEFLMDFEPDAETAIGELVDEYGLTVAEVLALGASRPDGAFSAVAHLRW